MIENNILRQKIVDNGLLYTPIAIPDILKDCLLILAHNKSGHNGFRRTYGSLKNRFHWKGLKKSIHLHCSRCQVCAKHNIKTQQLRNEHFSSPPQPMEFEWSQNTVLLASTQAVYKAPHSTVRECQTHTQSVTGQTSEQQ